MNLFNKAENSFKNETYWIVRSAGERTTELSVNLLSEFIPSQNICVINEIPFTKAIRKSFELGIEAGCKWTACLDADVLVLKNQLRKFFSTAEKTQKNIFCIQALIIDKFIPIRRPSGLHLYRTSLLEEALPLIPEKGISTRPESTTTQAMKDKGYYTLQTNTVIGLHDYEQYYMDIFRKTFIYAHKHEDILPRVESYWRKKCETDTDYEVALMGSLAGKLYDSTIYIDKTFQQKEADQLMEQIGVTEKPPLQTDALTHQALHSIYKNFKINYTIQWYKTTLYKKNYIRDIPQQESFFKKKLKDTISFFGLALRKIGFAIRRL